MKKLFYLFMVAMCATMFSACSDDDDKDPLDDDGEGKEGVITMTTEETDIRLNIETFKEGEIITIDWGDGNVEEFKSVRQSEDEYEYWGDYDDWLGERTHYVISRDYYVEHEYSRQKPYIVTIKGNIKKLDCNKYNNLTSLDVSKCPALTELDCSDNELTSLDVSKNTKLTYLHCAYTELTSLDVSKNTALIVLGCVANNLTSLDVSKNTALTLLDCSYNDLTSAALNQIFRDLPQGKTWTDKYEGEMQSTIAINANPGDDTCDKSIAENKGWEVNTTW